MVEIIIVPTIPHTGTHSILHLLDDEGYSKLKLLKKKDKNRKNIKKEDVFPVSTDTHNHILIWELLPTWQEFLDSGKDFEDHYLIDKNKINIIHGHIEREFIHIIDPLVRHHDTIIPLRDPLLTLVSTRNRDSLQMFRDELEEEKRIFKKEKPGIRGTMQKGMYNQIQGWVLWAIYLHKHSPFYVPLDLNKKDLKFKNYDFDKIGKHNSKGRTLLSKAYDEKNLSFLLSYLRYNFKILVEQESILRPPLEEIGYRDLLWWDINTDNIVQKSKNNEI